MSVQYCHYCDKQVDTDYHAEHFNSEGECIIEQAEYCEQHGHAFPLQDLKPWPSMNCHVGNCERCESTVSTTVDNKPLQAQSVNCMGLLSAMTQDRARTAVRFESDVLKACVEFEGKWYNITVKPEE